MSTADIELRWIPLGTLLVSAGLLTPEQLQHALEVKEESGGRLGQIVVDLGFASERGIAGALADQYGLEFVDLEATPPESRAIELLPEEIARRYEAIPIRFLADDLLLLGVVDPTNVLAADDLRLSLGTSFRLAVVDPSQLGLAHARAYRRPLELVATDAPRGGDDLRLVEEIRDAASSVPTINLVNRILATAVEEGASDIHLEPQRTRMLVRARLDGVMRELASIPKHMQAAVTSRLKIMGGLDIAERRVPQDGRVSVHFGGDPVDLRIAVVPTTDGEQVVLRLVNRRNQSPTLADLEMSLEGERAFLEAIEQPYGAVIVCGPTGSGKTTTLYGALGHLNRPDRVLMTIEDPVEHQLDGVNQVEADPARGADVRARAADDPAQRSRHPARRRDPRPGDGEHRHPGRDDGPPRAHLAARAQRGRRDRAPARHGRPAGPAREHAQLHRRPAARAAALRALPRALRGAAERARARGREPGHALPPDRVRPLRPHRLRRAGSRCARSCPCTARCGG